MPAIAISNVRNGAGSVWPRARGYSSQIESELIQTALRGYAPTTDETAPTPDRGSTPLPCRLRFRAPALLSLPQLQKRECILCTI